MGLNYGEELGWGVGGVVKGENYILVSERWDFYNISVRQACVST